MHCPRCCGLMVPVASLLHESNGEYPYLHSDRSDDATGWRCVNCGHRSDPVIERNRREHFDRALARLVEHHQSAMIFGGHA